MRIIVLLKPPESEKTCFQKGGSMTVGGSEEKRIGYDDGNALEMALQIKDGAEGGTVEIIALSAGSHKDETISREALALGVDRAILVSDARLDFADAAMTARCLAAAIGKIGDFDLLLAGYKSQDEKAGSVGPMTAEFLGIPQITHVNELRLTDRKVEVLASQRDFSVKMEATLPCCLVINKMKYSLRIMTLKGIRQTVNKTIKGWSLEDLRIIGDKWCPRTFVIHQFQNKAERKGRMITVLDHEQLKHEQEPSKTEQMVGRDQIKDLLTPMLSEIKSSFMRISSL